MGRGRVGGWGGGSKAVGQGAAETGGGWQGREVGEERDGGREEVLLLLLLQLLLL